MALGWSVALRWWRWTTQASTARRVMAMADAGRLGRCRVHLAMWYAAHCSGLCGAYICECVRVTALCSSPRAAALGTSFGCGERSWAVRRHS